MSGEAYAPEGTEGGAVASALAGLVATLESIDPGRPRRSLIEPGHYASVLDLDGRTGICICTDGVGTKLIVAEQARRFEGVGIDCVAMCVNDMICLGARPLALVDYIAVEQSDAETLTAIAAGLKRGAERAGIEIPGGELAQLPEMIRGHPSPGGIDLVGAGIGIVAIDAIVSGGRIEPGDVVIGLPSSGLHSNGFTLARRVLLDDSGHDLADVPPGLGRPLGDELLEPTEIYVAAIRALLDSGVELTGLAHISGDGLLNLLRLNANIGYEIDSPLEPQAIFGLIRDAGQLSPATMYQVFNMGIGFCCVVVESDASAAIEVLRSHYPAARAIGRATDQGGVVSVPAAGISGTRAGFGEPGVR